VERELSTGQNAVISCDWGSTAGSFHSWISVRVAGKTYDPSLTHGQSERFTWPNHAYFRDGLPPWASTCYCQPTYQIWSLYLHSLRRRRYERRYKML